MIEGVFTCLLNRLSSHQNSKVEVVGMFEVLEELDDLVEGNDSQVCDGHSEGIRVCVSYQYHQEESQNRDDCGVVGPVITLDYI